MIDWGLGHYERTAEELEPVADHIVALAGPGPRRRLLDLATGTGNAALAAARTGAEVTGLDLTPRLLAVARERAASEGLAIEFVEGDVQTLPFDDKSFDLVVSVFGMIFADDSERAFGELVRVLAPGGRGLFTAWVPAGAITAMIRVFGQAAQQATGQVPKRFPWHEREPVAALAERHGVEVHWHDGELRISDESPEAYLAAAQQHHPMSVALRPVLERAGSYDDVRGAALAVLRDHNEDPSAFAVRSPYVVIEVSA